ncbi:MAG: rhomboid family intramembrane serine protease [archaeon]
MLSIFFGKAFSFAKRFKATLFLALLLLVSYFWLSQGSLFIGKQLLLQQSFSVFQPWNFFSYMLAHISVWHLAVNVLSLLVFGSIVETALSSRDVLGIFVFCGALTVAFFVLLNPFAALVGASAGSSGIMASALILNIRKSLVALAIVAVLFFAAFQASSFAVQSQEMELARESTELGVALDNAIRAGNAQKSGEIAVEKGNVDAEISEFAESKGLASLVPVDFLIHGYAAVLGAIYLFLFRAGKTRAAIKKQDILGFARSAGK